ncbi:glycoside hydrolase family 3 C-terminal domain-containing protein [Streptomyces sp. LX-29]|uniref:glycoside hydrolase family 3 C-terminal domain-containing protein n=1 Tax=Streptomyces sp. LX-29 TaxID=2900152 RepID=UPI00240DD062|nr:glycoside hydrolase family 3 C-terminal domain-containing protein [Streptomyces sp. LX-29]WFB09748.1 glycoside hydrolase family 3 C-terminal domain-containing protein [Streptomyces sp. LX-29]
MRTPTGGAAVTAGTARVEAAVVAALGRLDLDTKTRLLAGQDMWSLPAVPEIGLRSLVMSDGPIGVRGVRWSADDPSVALPSPTALAATWDPELARRAGNLLAREARRKGVDVLLAPTVNLHRSPLGGRHFEAYSEDPLLTGEIGAAYVTGVQECGVGVTVKHFVANDAETERFTVDNRVPERALRELYLAPFEAIVRTARPWGVMAAYNSVNGTTMTEHRALLHEVLRGEWGFDGVIVSDWLAARDTVRALLGGLDLAMPGPRTVFGPALAAAVRAGEVPETAVDDAVRRVLRLAARVRALDLDGAHSPTGSVPAAEPHAPTRGAPAVGAVQAVGAVHAVETVRAVQTVRAVEAGQAVADAPDPGDASEPGDAADRADAFGLGDASDRADASGPGGVPDSGDGSGRADACDPGDASDPGDAFDRAAASDARGAFESGDGSGRADACDPGDASDPGDAFDRAGASDARGAFGSGDGSGRADACDPGDASDPGDAFDRAAASDARGAFESGDASGRADAPAPGDAFNPAGVPDPAGAPDPADASDPAGAPTIDGPALARLIARRGCVLLKNDGRVLPLDLGRPRRIALIGAAAREARAFGGGSAEVFPERVVSPLEGLRAALPAAHSLTYAVGADPSAELAVAGVGFTLRAVARGRDGRVLGERRLPSGEVRWLGGDLPDGVTHGELRTVEVVGTFTPRVDGAHSFGTHGVGGFRLAVDGRVLFEGEQRPGPGDPFEAFFGMPATRGRMELVAGRPVEVSLGCTVARIEDAPAPAVGFALTHREPEREPDELIEEAVAAAAAADTAVVVVATTARVESEGFDRTDLRLPGRQDELVARVAAVNPRTVVVVNSGAPVELPWREEVAAVLLCWFPGQEGGAALADVLSGACEPGGRLPTTWPARLSDAPVSRVVPAAGVLDYAEGVFIGYRAWDRAGATPAYPFGHGLGYTDWAYECLEATPDGGTVRATVRVRNVGPRPGREVVQIYLAPLADGGGPERPARWLAGFAGVFAAPGEAVEVTVPLRRRAFEVWDDATRSWRFLAGAYAVEAARSVADRRLSTPVTVEAGH